MNLDAEQSLSAPIQSNCQPSTPNLDNQNYSTGNDGINGYNINPQNTLTIPSQYNPSTPQNQTSNYGVPTSDGQPIIFPAPNQSGVTQSDCQQYNNFFTSQFWYNYFLEQYIYYNFKLPPFQWYLDRIFKSIAKNFKLNAQGFQVIVNAGITGYDGFINMIVTIVITDPQQANLLLKQAVPTDQPQTNYNAPGPYPDPSLPSSKAPANPYIPPNSNYNPVITIPPINISGGGANTSGGGITITYGGGGEGGRFSGPGAGAF